MILVGCRFVLDLFLLSPRRIIVGSPSLCSACAPPPPVLNTVFFTTPSIVMSPEPAILGMNLIFCSIAIFFLLVDEDRVRFKSTFANLRTRSFRGHLRT